MAYEFFGIPIPDELAAQIDHQDMALESYKHDVQRMFEELDKDNLVTLRRMLNHLAADETHRLAAYYEGIVVATISYKHKVCGGCGQDHNADIADIADIAEKLKDKRTTVIEVKDDPPNLFNVPSEENGLSELTIEQFKLMTEYNLDDLRDIETLKLLGFVCKNCSLRYESIEDRMLRPVDGCHGCHVKSAHG